MSEVFRIATYFSSIRDEVTLYRDEIPRSLVVVHAPNRTYVIDVIWVCVSAVVFGQGFAFVCPP